MVPSRKMRTAIWFFYGLDVEIRPKLTPELFIHLGGVLDIGWISSGGTSALVKNGVTPRTLKAAPLGIGACGTNESNRSGTTAAGMDRAMADAAVCWHPIEMGGRNPDFWDLEIQKFGVQKMENIKLLKIQIRPAQNVGKVWISRNKASLGPSEAIFSMDPGKSKNMHNFVAYFPWWANGPYSPGVGPCCYPPEVGK